MDKKNVYKVTFYAPLDDSDVHAMNHYFFDTMEEAMEIPGCYDLHLELEEEVETIHHQISLGLEDEGDLWQYDPKTDDLYVQKDLFLDPVVEGDKVQIYDREDDAFHIYEVDDIDEGDGFVKLVFRHDLE